jgi:uncharacterized protein (DUF427 family)
MNAGGSELSRKRGLRGKPPLPKVRKVNVHLAVVLGGTVLAETRSAKELFDLIFFPLGDVRTEYLTPARLRPERDEIGESQYISIEVEGKVVCEKGARFYYRPRPPYRALKDHITFDPLTIDAYYMDGHKTVIPPHSPRRLAPEGGRGGILAA